MWLLSSFATAAAALAQAELGTPRIDRSKAVPPKPAVVAAWRQRQDNIKTLRFAWTEEQVHVAGWMPNWRLTERDRLSLPRLLTDRGAGGAERRVVVSKSLVLDGTKTRYSFDLERTTDFTGLTRFDNRAPRHFTYTSVFDGGTGTSRVTAASRAPGESVPDVISRGGANLDAQSLDTRPILMTFRPLDPVLGHPLLDRAVTNTSRFFYKDRSTMILEEWRDPAGWKMLMWLEPERDFIVTRYIVAFEQNVFTDIEIDYVMDQKWGWVPSGWRVTHKLEDGSRRVLSTAKVTSYAINEPVSAREFRLDVVNAVPATVPGR
jgi:hypothetical protein